MSVRLGDRPRGAVLADMIEGIVVANYLENSKADLVRSALWLAIDGDADAGELILRNETSEPIQAASPQPNATAAAA